MEEMKQISNDQVKPTFESLRNSSGSMHSVTERSSSGRSIDSTPSTDDEEVSSDWTNHDDQISTSSAILSARELTIVHGEDPSNWRWRSDDSSGVEVAELVKVWWLDIRGFVPVRNLCQSASYEAFFVFKLSCSPLGLESADASVRIVNQFGHYGDGGGSVVVSIDNRRRGGGRFPESRSDGWMEIKLGSFVNNHEDENCGCSVEMKVFKTTSDHIQKSGLIAKGFELRPLLN